MIYGYRVKRNGIYYAAGEEVPDFEERGTSSDSGKTGDLNLQTDVIRENGMRRGRPKKTD